MPVKTHVAKLLLLTLSSLPGLAQAAEAEKPIPDTPIIVTAPGGDVDRDDAVRLGAAELEMISGPDVVRAVSTRLAGVSLAEAIEWVKKAPDAKVTEGERIECAYCQQTAQMVVLNGIIQWAGNEKKSDKP